MEQTDACKCHYDAVFVTGFDYVVVPNRTARLSNYAYA